MKSISMALLLSVMVAILVGCQNINDVPIDPQMESSNRISVDTLTQEEVSETTNFSAGRLIEQIKNGDYSSIVGADEGKLDQIRSNIDIYNEMEWVEGDIDGDGSKELIRRYTGSHQEKMRMILVIFAFDDDKTIVVYCRTGVEQMTSSYFLGGNENLLYHYQFHGVIGEDTYLHCTFDSEWNMAQNYGFRVTTIPSDTDSSDLPPNWAEERPNIVEPGIYYEEITRNNDGYDAKLLTEELFHNAFEEMSGISFHDILPSF